MPRKLNSKIALKRDYAGGNSSRQNLRLELQPAHKAREHRGRAARPRSASGNRALGFGGRLVFEPAATLEPARILPGCSRGQSEVMRVFAEAGGLSGLLLHVRSCGGGGQPVFRFSSNARSSDGWTRRDGDRGGDGRLGREEERLVRILRSFFVLFLALEAGRSRRSGCGGVRSLSQALELFNRHGNHRALKPRAPLPRSTCGRGARASGRGSRWR